MDFSGCDRCHPSGVQGRLDVFLQRCHPSGVQEIFAEESVATYNKYRLDVFLQRCHPSGVSRDIRRRVCRDLQQIPTSTVGWVEREKPRTLSFPETVPVCDMLRISVFSEPQQASDLRRNNTISKSLYCINRT